MKSAPHYLDASYDEVTSISKNRWKFYKKLPNLPPTSSGFNQFLDTKIKDPVK
jgi:hypothetical protein